MSPALAHHEPALTIAVLGAIEIKENTKAARLVMSVKRRIKTLKDYLGCAHTHSIIEVIRLFTEASLEYKPKSHIFSLTCLEEVDTVSVDELIHLDSIHQTEENHEIQ